MKKFLSLVLALVMTMSLVTISAGAKDFTDAGKTTYRDAVDVMSELDVIDGYTGGDFRPQNTLTRGAAAKIICNLVLGPTTADTLNASTAPFKDVPADSTFAGYITYCSQQKIINGYSDGTFRPSNTLNGYAFMKMLLGALGYDGSIEGFTGPNWTVNVAKLAVGIGLADDLEGQFVGSKAVTREEACLYALNTLQATMVEYDAKTSVTVNGAEVVVGGSEAKDMANNSKNETFDEDGKMQFAEKYFSNLKTSETEDDFGRPAKVWKIKNKEIGTYADDADLTYTKAVEGQDLRSDLGKGDIEVEDYVVDGDASVSVPAGFKVEKGNDVEIGAKGTLTQVYVIEHEDADDEIRIVSIQSHLAQVSGDYNEDDDELDLDDVNNSMGSAELTLSGEDFANLSSFEDEEYVVVTVAKDEVKSIAKAEKVSGAVTAFTSEKNVTVGGTKYEYDATYDQDLGFADNYSIKDDYDLYLDAYGYVLYADGVEADDRYVFVDDIYTSNNSDRGSLKAFVYFQDGTAEDVTVNKIDGKKVDNSDYDENESYAGWYTYTMTGEKYNLNAVTTDVETGVTGTITEDDSVTISYAGKTAKGNSSTVFIVVDEDDEASVYTGIKNVPEITGGSDVRVSVVKDGSYAKYVFVDLGKDGTSSGGTDSGDVIFVYKNTKPEQSTDSDENVYYTYKSVLNTKIEKVNFTDEFGPGEVKVALYAEVEYDENDYVTKAKEVTSAYATKNDDKFSFDTVTSGDVEYKKDVLTIGGESYYMATGAKVFVAEGGDVDTFTAKALAKEYENGLSATVYGVKNADGDFTALYIAK